MAKASQKQGKLLNLVKILVHNLIFDQIKQWMRNSEGMLKIVKMIGGFCVIRVHDLQEITENVVAYL
jgi:hypothetical protein